MEDLFLVIHCPSPLWSAEPPILNDKTRPRSPRCPIKSHPNKPILVVDLDRRLITRDLFFESLWSALSKDARTAFHTCKNLLTTKTDLRTQLTQQLEINPVELPYDEAVLDIVRAWRGEGGRTALVTTFDLKFADAVAGHLGLFDEVHASDCASSLRGRITAEFLVNRFGAGKYNYIGHGHGRLPARHSLMSHVPGTLEKSIEPSSPAVEHLSNARRNWSAYVRLLRPEQWLKNALIFLPAIAAQQTGAPTWLAALLGFVAFSLVASSVYVVNDLLDLSADRAHPRKRSRPLASGSVPLAHGTAIAPALLLAGFFFAALLGRLEFLGLLALYFVLAVAYSLSLKRKLVIDICTLAGFYALRILAGGLATGLHLSVWLLVFSVFFFLSMAAVKRQAELVDGLVSGRTQASGRAYHVDDLPIVSSMAVAAGYVAVLVMALYINSEAVQTLYSSPQILWAVCPVLLYWISRMVMIAHRGNMQDDPIVFAVRDRVSQICGLLIVGIVIAGSIV